MAAAEPMDIDYYLLAAAPAADAGSLWLVALMSEQLQQLASGGSVQEIDSLCGSQAIML